MIKKKKDSKENIAEPKVQEKEAKPIKKTELKIKITKKPWYKNSVLLLILFFILIVAIFRIFLPSYGEEVDYATLLTRIEEKDYSKVEIKNQTVYIKPKNNEGTPVYGTIANPDLFQEDLRLLEVDPKSSEIYFVEESGLDIFDIITIVFFLMLICGLGYLFFAAKSIGSGGPMMNFGDTKAKLFSGEKQNIKFDQIKGVDEALDDVKEIVSFLKQPEKFVKLGARIPKGILLVGSPGTGKTLLARAIAGEAEVPFFFTSGSEFEEMLVGTGASRVRDLFSKAKKASPAIIFIDEIDSIARKRGTVINSGNTEQTLNQILVEMDGFDKTTNIIIIAATNRPDVLDPAILRPGRFDRRVILELPDVKGREEILKVHSANKPLASDVNLETIAKRTIGFSGADLENTLNEAAIIAAKANRKEITAEDIEESATKVTIGPAKKRAKSEKQKTLVAYHEAGHAIAGYFMKDVDKVHRISIVSRGYTGGVTMYLPDEDERDLTTNTKFFGELVTLFGGRTAEKLKFDDVTTGASSDIQKATQIARDMVKKYGMSKLGYVDLHSEDQYTGKNLYSDKTAELIDIEVTKILKEAQEKCEEILTQNIAKLDELSAILIDREVVESEEFYAFMEGKDISKKISDEEINIEANNTSNK